MTRIGRRRQRTVATRILKRIIIRRENIRKQRDEDQTHDIETAEHRQRIASQPPPGICTRTERPPDNCCFDSVCAHARTSLFPFPFSLFPLTPSPPENAHAGLQRHREYLL